MINIKIKTTEHVPKELTQSAKIPKQIVSKSLLHAKDKVAETTEKQQKSNKSPHQYAEEKIEQTAKDIADKTTQITKAQIRKGVNRIRQNTKNTAADVSKKSAKGTIKTTQKSVKTARTSVKTGSRAIKTSAKAAVKTAKTSSRAIQAARETAKAAATAFKATAKAVITTVKLAIAAVKSLVSAIAAGGWVAVVVVLVIAVIALILGSAFGIFFADDVTDSVPIKEAAIEINSEFQSKIESRISELSKGEYDEIKVVYEGDADGDSCSTNNWNDILTVFAVKYMSENIDVITITPDKIAELRNVFYIMNSFSSRTKTETKEVTTNKGEEETTIYTTLIIYIKITSLDYMQGMAIYSFTEKQIAIADEMMSPAYYILFSQLLGVDLFDGTDLTGIISGLPVGKMGSEMIKVAVTKLGCPYVWGAKGSSKFDCSGLTYWSINQVDLTLGSEMYTNAAGQAKWCYDNGYMVGRSELQPGDLVFWQNLGCSGCSRWREIHHVGFYIGDGKVLEASSSKGRVVIRDLWESKGYPLFGFARPYKY